MIPNLEMIIFRGELLIDGSGMGLKGLIWFGSFFLLEEWMEWIWCFFPFLFFSF